MPLTDEEIKSALDILKALDGAIDKGPWEHNLFFKGIGKKLRDARDKFKEELGLDELTADLLSQNKSNHKIDNQSTEVYVSLYQAEGSNITKWTTVVNSLAGYNLTRPVYRNEVDIQAAIRAKDQQQNDAYVAVRVRNIDILKVAEKQPTDKLGHELLVLREGAIHLENISRFVHKSGHYQFRNKLLSKV